VVNNAHASPLNSGCAVVPLFWLEGFPTPQAASATAAQHHTIAFIEDS
jgi:hypothetical protein